MESRSAYKHTRPRPATFSLNVPMANGVIPPPPRQPVSDVHLEYSVRDPWAWIIQKVSENSSPGIVSMKEVSVPSDLESYQQVKAQEIAATPVTPSRRYSSSKRGPKPCTLRADLVSDGTTLRHAVHGTSCAFDGLEDKDQLVRTLQRCRCEHLNLSPPSILISWDVRREECKNVVGEQLPALPGNPADVAVLKEPMGSRGEGIYFVSSADDIYEIMEKHRKRAVEEGSNFLDSMIAQKGRIPSWVLQAEIYPPLLIHDGRKFHIRTYVVAVEKLDHPNVLDVYVYNRHEVRIASEPVNEDDLTGSARDRKAHITNGALLDETERILLQNVPELVERNIQENVELFVAQLFGKHLTKDISRRVIVSANQDGGIVENVKKFAIAGLDIMLTADDRIYLLEANVNPAAPPQDTVDDEFCSHLVGFMSDLLALTLGRTIRAPIQEPFFGGATNFRSVQDIL